MLKQLVTAVLGTRFDRELKRIQPLIDAIHEHEERLGALPESDIRAQTMRFRGMLRERVGDLEDAVAERRREKHDCADPDRRQELEREIQALDDQLKEDTAVVLEELLPEAFATVREACRRLKGTTVVVTGREMVWDMVPYDVQLIGGIVLHQGKIAEMATGEGKTLVATLPMYLNALPGRGVHLVTVNDYLSRRDSQWMGHVLSWLGLRVACLDDTQPSSPERRAAYGADITYGTNNEFGFDYLRDNMVFANEHRVQRSHHYAIVDEVDSILVDEARTPLIISGPVGNEEDRKYGEYNGQVRDLFRKQTGVVNELVAAAEGKVEANPEDYEGALLMFKAQRGGPKNKRLMKLLQDPQLQQKVQRVELDYLADRKLPASQQKMRDVEEDLFYVLDERGHAVHLTDKGVESLSPDDPELFVIPDISEAIGAIERDDALSAPERVNARLRLEAEYAAKSEKLHIIHKLLQAYALYEKDVGYVVQEGQVFIVDEFTGRIMAGRRWSDGLHQAVEAKEGVTVRGETQTLATITIQNYFRMYDKLSGMTGTAETEETEFFEIYGLDVMVIPTNRPVRRVDAHDKLYRTRREKYNAIGEEVERQHARGLPVLVGTVTVEVSETLSRLLKRRGLKHEVLNAKYHQREAEIVAGAGQAGAITIATNMAGRGTDIKLGPGVRQCAVCGIKAKLAPFGQQRERPDLSDAQLGERGCNQDPPCGLVIIGTERHESRRIDRQLRGRSGRQGDPGQSVFFLSLEDDLMRLFQTERVSRWMEKAGAEEGEVITHPLVTRAIGNAQKRVELRNFQSRKRLLEYDDVMNQQREVIYSTRLFALEGGEELKAEAQRMLEEAGTQYAQSQVAGNPELWDREAMQADLRVRFLLAGPDITNAERIPDAEALATYLREEIVKAFRVRLDNWRSLGAMAGPPIPDLDERLLAHIVLGLLDEKWKDHLYDLDQLRNAIQYRAWGQKDPLVEYKGDAFEMFVDLMNDIRTTFAERFFRFQVQVDQAPPQRRAPPRTAVHPASDTDLMVGGGSPAVSPPRGSVRAGVGNASRPVPRGQPDLPKVGRNDPCPCGSGKKYKKCHGASA